MPQFLILIHRRIVVVMTLGAILAATGCARTPPPTFYQLAEPAAAQLAGIERGVAIGIGPLAMASYLDRPQIVTRATDHRLIISEANVWAEPLHDAVGTVVGVQLSNLLHTNRVFRFPLLDRSIPLDFRVSLALVRFDGTLGEDAQLTARWTIFDRADKPVLTRVSIINEPAGGDGYEDLIAAQNRTLQKLSSEIAKAISE